MTTAPDTSSSSSSSSSSTSAGPATDSATDSDAVDTTSTTGAPPEPVCGDGVVNADLGEECDDGNNEDGDGCAADCTNECPGEIFLDDWNGYQYWKVQVEGTMTDTNVLAACQACGLSVPCQSTGNCVYNDDSCLQTGNETSCGNPMLNMSQMLCNGQSPSQCNLVWDLYQHLGFNWVNESSCGAKQNQWCVQGAGQSNEFALCVTQL